MKIGFVFLLSQKLLNIVKILTYTIVITIPILALYEWLKVKSIGKC